MASEDIIDLDLQPSSAGALDILVGAGIDRAAAEQILGIVPVQYNDNPVRTEENSGSDEASRASFEMRMMAMMEGFSQKLNELASKVESTDGATGSGTSTEVPPVPTPSSASTSRTDTSSSAGTSSTDNSSSASTSRTDNSSQVPKHWADRRLDEPLNLPPVHWPDDEESETASNLVEVSPETSSFLQSCFGKPLNNSARQGLRKTVGVPKVDATKCPKMDCVVKGSVSKETKDADTTLAKMQTLVLDAVAPLVHILESAKNGKLTNDTSEKASKLALRLLANASAHIAKERRKNALKDLNKDLLTLVEDEERFANVAPMLFGDGFEKTMKEHVEAMRCIRKSSNNSKSAEPFFWKGRPSGQYYGNGHHRGGGNSHRGRGRYHPYYRGHSGGKENFSRKKPQNSQS